MLSVPEFLTSLAIFQQKQKDLESHGYFYNCLQCLVEYFKELLMISKYSKNNIGVKYICSCWFVVCKAYQMMTQRKIDTFLFQCIHWTWLPYFDMDGCWLCLIFITLLPKVPIILHISERLFLFGSNMWLCQIFPSRANSSQNFKFWVYSAMWWPLPKFFHQTNQLPWDKNELSCKCLGNI